jgi:hypothetical protein
MKARVKSTGEIVNVYNWGDPTFRADNGNIYQRPELDFDVEGENDPDYWTRLEHTYAGMAMQGILSNPESELDYKGDEALPQALAGCAAKVAHALVEKLKEKEERK